MNMASNLYLVGTDLSDGMPQVESIQKEVKAFLRENLFVRLYVHFVHSAPLKTLSDIDYYYQYYYQSWKRSALEFDREGYAHQEVPRMMLLPVIVPQKDADPQILTGLLRRLKEAFLMPSLYLDEDTFPLVRNDGLRRSTEKLYYGTGDSCNPGNIVLNLCYQNMVEDLTDRLESDVGLADNPCSPALIISARDGTVYRCVGQFVEHKSLGNIYDAFDGALLMGRYVETGESQDNCLRCKERAVGSFVKSPLPKKRTQEIGALLYRFGTLHHEAGRYDQAVESLKASLAFSPSQEMGAVYFQLGLCYTKTGAYDKAIEAFGNAAPAFGAKHFFHFYLGLCHFEKGSYQKALDAFLKAEALGPPQDDLVRILIYAGTCYNNLGDHKKAVVPLEKAKGMAPQVKEIFSTLGFSYFQLTDYDNAIDNLKKAVELDPFSAIDYASLGANYREKGDRATAIAMFEKALERDPAMEAARQNLERLKYRHG
jgi:tetratricopeptide (TPR) repeat protein